ncbi:MAG: PrsW family intramembrane metalloprotease [Bacteroidales bacterium]|nr:PrsW family intramembrane metalloprotease [Bacteroidales bacterium]
MAYLQYFSLAISPVLLVVGIFLLKNMLDVASFKNFRNSILFGLFGVILLLLANYLIDLRWHGALRNMRRMAFFVFVVTAFSSELGKFLPLRLSSYKLPSFKGPIEGIIYSVAIGLGFSTVATVLFAFGVIGTERIHNITLFLFLYPFANIVFSIVLGFFTGMGKLRKNTLIDHSTGIFLATFLHGVFYFSFITHDIRLLVFIIVGYILVSIALLYRAVQLFNKRD